jgi:hypothetical protein
MRGESKTVMGLDKLNAPRSAPFVSARLVPLEVEALDAPLHGRGRSGFPIAPG